VPGWIQCLETGKLIPRELYVRPNSNKSAMIEKPMDAFVSQVDGTEIRDRKQLADHNRRNGVTNSADYSSDYSERTTKARHAKQRREAKIDRVAELHKAIHHHTHR
jgi:hypothetical protein